MEAAKRTNIQFEWEYGSAADTMTSFSLMLASGTYSDLFVGGPNFFAKGEQMGIEEDIIIDLKPIIEAYCPNYYSVYTSDDIVRRVVLNDNLAIPAFRMVNVTPQTTYLGYFSTEAALESAGFSADNLPYTLDDYESVLTSCNGKIYLSSNVGQDFILMSAFNTGSGFFSKDDTVVFGPATDEYRSYLELLSDWYGKGLIDPDYMSRTSYYIDSGVFISGDVSIYPAPYNFISVYEEAGMNPVALPNPHINKGDARYTNFGKTERAVVMTPSAYISTQCEDPITLAKFFDYVYTDEGVLLFNYGIENKSYTMVDGEPVFTDLVINNPDGLPYSQASAKYACSTLFPMYYLWERELTMCTQSALDAQELWHSDRDFSKTIGQYGTLTTEELEATASASNDITAYVNEFTNKVIVGEESLDNWDTFVAGLEQMNLQACIDAYQAAYERYLAR